MDEVHVVHVDRCMLDTDQHLVGARCRRFKKVGKLDRREVRPARPVSWVLRFTPDRSYTLRSDDRGIAKLGHHARHHVVEIVAVKRPVAGIVGIKGDRSRD